MEGLENHGGGSDSQRVKWEKKQGDKGGKIHFDSGSFTFVKINDQLTRLLHYVSSRTSFKTPPTSTLFALRLQQLLLLFEGLMQN